MAEITQRDAAPGPGVSPEAVLAQAQEIALEWGAKPGDMKAVAYVAACIAAGLMIGGIHRHVPPREATLNLDKQRPVV